MPQIDADHSEPVDAGWRLEWIESSNDNGESSQCCG
jgi:hypothetical protein